MVLQVRDCFKGGKGVASTLGVVLMVNPAIFALVISTMLPLVFITRIISIASIGGAIMFAVLTCTWAFLFTTYPLYYSVCAVIIGAMIVAAHRDNVKRLHNGTESRLGKQKKQE
jgi:glycerol-3-phosphate acyltransferase PlsY